jgi:hypothetical protein
VRNAVSVVLVLMGVILVVLGTLLVALVHSMARDGWASWPKHAIVPATGGALGLAMIVAGVVRWRRAHHD